MPSGIRLQSASDGWDRSVTSSRTTRPRGRVRREPAAHVAAAGPDDVPRGVRALPCAPLFRHLQRALLQLGVVQGVRLDVAQVLQGALGGEPQRLPGGPVLPYEAVD
eukprot:CAMPEP_0179322848 /NCGR_PEP_ID=MMETSP0797-20121207/59397_1 /TAXON_ID=47934 /ORGANISM="Dinophysis acuminata, Strain DAEP01" /LENGTH=106 /DNA_ID=CAMNT_0021034633 /DNA_START=254 /DNA_END=574 /DNA_ORIENTATION=+